MIEYYRSANFDPGKPFRIADLHAHTTLSDGQTSVPELVRMAVLQGFGALAITDHDRIATSLQAVEYASRKGLPIQIVPGSEITTNAGHLLALGIKDDIPKGLSLPKTVTLIHKQGGIAIAPHPFYKRLQGQQLGSHALLQIRRDYNPYDHIDAIEVRNGGIAATARGSKANEEALAFYLKHADYFGAAIGASDAHRFDVGSTVTAFQGDLFEAIKTKRTAVLYQDRQESLQRIFTAVGIAGKKVLEGVPKFITGRNARRVLQASVFGVRVDDEEHALALKHLTDPENIIFNDLKERRQASWVASRIALKMAYRALVGSETFLLNFIQVGNKSFGNRRNGPPFIIDGKDFYYSLSHDGNIGIGAVANFPIGVDVQRTIYGRITSLKIFRDEEITAEAAENDLSLEEIIAKLWTVKEAVAKGTQIGLSKQLTLNLTKKISGEYIVEPCYKGVVLPPWQARVFRRGDCFIAAAVMGTEPSLALNWIELDSKSSV